MYHQPNDLAAAAPATPPPADENADSGTFNAHHAAGTALEAIIASGKEMKRSLGRKWDESHVGCDPLSPRSLQITSDCRQAPSAPLALPLGQAQQAQLLTSPPLPSPTTPRVPEPSQMPAPSMPSTAGPFLRYGNNLPGSDAWTGSVLFLTRGPAAGDSNGNGSLGTDLNGGDKVATTGAATAATSPAPVLTYDEGAGVKEVAPQLLEEVLGWSFWRFDLALTLGQAERPVHYAVRPAGGAEVSAAFWLPARGRPFHWGYTSCNGISGDVPDDHYSRKEPTYLWRDLLQLHAAFPLHALVGGGDQVYNDAVWKESAALAEWGDIEEHEEKVSAPWTPALQSQATSFYLRNYIQSYTMPDVCTAYASIPSVMVWDDHDIWDGYGSYDPDLQGCAIFRGLFAVAHRFYLLFQQHTVEAREAAHSEFLHHDEGYHSVRFMGPQVALMCIDMRTRRTKKEIMPESTYQLLRSTMLELPDSVHHVVALSGVPLVFPNIPMSEAILGSLKTLAARSPCFRRLERGAGLLDRFDQPEILDDLVDGWAAKIHTEERLAFIHLLQEVALTKGVRVSILSGDAHVGGVGQLYSRPKQEPQFDPLYMPQIISSAIMNSPPPFGVVKMLMRTNVAKNTDERTREKMVRAFWPHHPRTDKLIAQRNWCDVCLLVPPYTPPTNPEDPGFGGLRFALRVEDPEHRKGFAEEVYDIVVPRAPGTGVGGKHGAGIKALAGAPAGKEAAAAPVTVERV